MTVPTTVNYSGRTVDLLIHQGIDVSGERQVALSLGDQGSVCTGIQKAAQQFCVMFLTDKGSRFRDPTFGTNFLNDLRSGRIQNDETLQSSYEVAVLDIFQYINENDISGEPDENIVDAQLVWWDLRRGFLAIKVQITSEAGESRVVHLPVKVPIR
jgi:hypothetical protein